MGSCSPSAPPARTEHPAAPQGRCWCTPGSHQLLGKDLGEKQEPSVTFSKGSVRVGGLFPFSEGANSCKTSSLLFTNPSGASSAGGAGGIHLPEQPASLPGRAGSLAIPIRVMQRIPPGLSRPIPGAAVPAAGRFLRSLLVRVCFSRRFFGEFPLPSCCVTSGSFCRSLSKRWSTAQLFLI